jgi:hypothetical protein
MSGATDYTIEELSEMLVDSILKEQFLSKDNLRPKVQAFIKAFVNLKNIPKNYNKYESRTKRAARLRWIEKCNAECKFWQSIVAILDPDNMQKYYKQQDAMLVAKGFKDIKDI